MGWSNGPREGLQEWYRGAGAYRVGSDLVLDWFRVCPGLVLAWSGLFSAPTLPLWGRVAFGKRGMFWVR